MKKLLKIMAIAISVIVMATCFIACGDQKDAPLDFVKVTRTAKSYTKATEVDMKGYTILRQTDHYVEFVKEVEQDGDVKYRHVLYDLDLKKVVDTVDFYSSNAVFSYIDKVAVNTTEQYAIENAGITLYYKGKATEVKGATYNEVDVEYDLLKADNNIYRLKDSGLEKLNPVKVIDIEDIEYASGGYYYVEDDGNFIAYNSNLNVIGRVLVPNRAESTFVNVLANGNLVVQTIYDGTADDYDVLVQGDYFKYETQIYNVREARLEDIDVNYLFQTIIPMEEIVLEGMELEVEGIDNLGMGLEIIDKKANDESAATRVFNVSNAFEVSSFEKFHTAQDYDFTIPVAKDRFALILVDGTVIIVNQYAETIVHLAEFDIDDITSDYIITDDKIYDMNGKVVVDLAGDGYTLDYVFNTNVMLRKETTYEKTYAGDSTPTTIIQTEYFLLKDNQLISIAKTNNDKEYTENSYPIITARFGDMYVLGSEQKQDGVKYTTYTLYSENGVKLVDKTFSSLTLDNLTPDLIGGFTKVIDVDGLTVVRLETRVYNSERSAYESVYTYYELS